MISAQRVHVNVFARSMPRDVSVRRSEPSDAMRRMARRLIRKQMLAAVQTADVIVTNPTHFAVALKYERGTDKAPIILAKGMQV